MQKTATRAASLQRSGTFSPAVLDENNSSSVTLQEATQPRTVAPLVTGKVLSVEAQRIMAVLQEAERKLQIIAAVPDQIDRRVFSVLGTETATILQEYRQAEVALTQTLEKKVGNVHLDPKAPVSPFASPMNESKEETRHLRTATRALVRQLMQHPEKLVKLGSFKTTRLAPLEESQRYLHELTALVFERLQTSVEEERARQNELSLITAKERKTSEEVRQLGEELERAKQERAIEVTKRNDIIRKLKEQLREIKQHAEDSTKKLETRSKQKEDSDLEVFREKEKVLGPEIDRLLQSYIEMCRQNREEELALRKKKFKIETEVENWIHKYDQELEEKQNEIEEVTAIFNEERAQLEELRRRFAELEAEHNQILEEKAREAEQKRMAFIELMRLNKYATMIQAAWRGRMARNEMKKSKKNEKKKK